MNGFHSAAQMGAQASCHRLGGFIGLTGDEDWRGTKEQAEAADDVRFSAVLASEDALPVNSQDLSQSRSDCLSVREDTWIDLDRIVRAIPEIVDSDLIPGMGQSLDHSLKATGHDLQMIAHLLVGDFGCDRMCQMAIAVAVEKDFLVGELWSQDFGACGTDLRKSAIHRDRDRQGPRFGRWGTVLGHGMTQG